jgi:thioester reductase-like protein
MWFLNVKELYDRLIEASRLENYEERMLRLKELLDELPDCNYLTLRFLMEHLHNVASQQEVNKVNGCSIRFICG